MEILEGVTLPAGVIPGVTDNLSVSDIAEIRRLYGCSDVKTIGGNANGEYCHFPFKYNGTEYNHCIMAETNGTVPLYWCSINQFPTYDNIIWGYCLFGSAETLSTNVLTTNGESCHFPFYYKDKRYDFCTSVDWRSMWCSLNETFDGHWGSCALPYGGAWSSWGAWSTCGTTCGGGQRSRIRLCDNPVPINGGPTCPGDGIEHQPCQTVECPTSGETFVKIGCFEDVGWPSSFALLENKSPYLDDEFATRTDKLRKCALAAGSMNHNAVGLRAGGMCLAETLTVETLRDMTPSTACGNEGTGGENAMDVYALDEVLLVPDWSAWQAFTACSKTCGSGTRTRNRQCWDPKDLAFVDPTLCGGSETESESCSTDLCPINGVWGSWSEWSTCTSGIKYRSRECNNPPPSNGGAQCPGEATDPLLC
ncbi:coadhesin-like [Tubulanus polymorphus]|uniref:coadhesin-like n=1 Tax=Tubulanus polymorphus TaxID=672921 RepID=UPI003DA66E36